MERYQMYQSGSQGEVHAGSMYLGVTFKAMKLGKVKQKVCKEDTQHQRTLTLGWTEQDQ